MNKLETFSKIKDEILKANSIAITAHVNPDGDNLGSVLAMYSMLKTLGKDPEILIDDEIPSTFKFLPNIGEIKRPENFDKVYDLIIVLDSGDVGRIGRTKMLFEKAKMTVNLDHHMTNPEYAKLNYVGKRSATGEVLFEFFESCGLKLNREIATCLFTAISSDTGSFKYDSTTDYTFYAASKLMEEGIDINEIAVNLFQNRSKSRTELLISAAENANYYFNDRVCIGRVTNKMMSDFSCAKHDSEGIVEFLRDTDTVEVAVLLKERAEGGVRVSLRSKYSFDCSKVALAFNGGGHMKAAGCTVEGSIEDVEKSVLSEIKKQIQ